MERGKAAESRTHSKTLTRILDAPEKREASWSAQTGLRFPTARHVAPIKAATCRRTPKRDGGWRFSTGHSRSDQVWQEATCQTINVTIFLCGLAALRLGVKTASRNGFVRPFDLLKRKDAEAQSRKAPLGRQAGRKRKLAARARYGPEIERV